MKSFGARINILIFFLVIALVAISPKLDVSGAEISSLDQISSIQGLKVGDIVTEINNFPVTDPEEFYRLLREGSYVEPKFINLITSEGTAVYSVTDDLKFNLNNLTISNSNITGIKDGAILEEINGNKILTREDFEKVRYDLLPSKSIQIKTSLKEFNFLTNSELEINVKEVSRTNVRKGLDLEGGTRVVLKPATENFVSDDDIDNLIAVMRNRLNVYGLTDLKIRAAETNEEKLILIEIAGIPREEIEDFVSQQGKFEAKIGNETVFTGGKESVPFVCKDDGTCSGVRACNPNGPSDFSCRFEFSIKLSTESAKRHAEITNKLDVIASEYGGSLSEPLDLYLDGNLIDSLQISESLKGSETTDILISGPGDGATQQEALDDALDQMEKLQTVMITGSLPFKLDIVKLDSISPVFGTTFIKNAFVSGLIALLSVLIVIFIRYRNLKVVVPMAITLGSELFIILGFASAIGWNLDLAAIAGIIASIGTGVDDQIVITDEIMKGRNEEFFSWKEKLKRAFFIIFVAYAATVVAMIPLWSSVAGLLRGFALTTIVGVSIGVFITRPAFAAMLEKLMNK